MEVTSFEFGTVHSKLKGLHKLCADWQGFIQVAKAYHFLVHAD
jgi:hypothetical protein